MDRDWEPLLYAKKVDYSTLALLPSHTRVTVEGTVHMVIYFLKKIIVIITYTCKFQ